MGDAMGGMFKPDMSKTPVVAAVNAPDSVKALAGDSVVKVVDEGALPSAEEMQVLRGGSLGSKLTLAIRN